MMSSKPFYPNNPADIAVEISRKGAISVSPLNRPIWKTPPKITHVLWCTCGSDARWYLHLGEIVREAPPLPTLDHFLRHYEKMTQREVINYLSAHNLTAECLEQEIEDTLWPFTWDILYSPMSKAYDFLWERDIPNKSPFCDQLLFEQDNGLAVMPRQVSTDDIFCLQALQAELYEEGVALVVA